MNVWRALTWAGSAAATALTAHSLLNARALRTPALDPPSVPGRVSVLVPVRDEEDRIGACLTSLLDQVALPDYEVVVLDDASTDRTPEVVGAVAGGDPRVRLVRTEGPPAGWLGKTHACHLLSRHATGEVLVFVDADVVLAPHAVAAAVDLLHRFDLDVVCPYPRQLALSWSERLVQPLLQWSWLTTLPLRHAEVSPRPSLAAANGQFLVADAATYRRAGGHEAVRAEVLDDIALLRAVKAVGGRGGVADGTALATCRMYRGWTDLRAGYTKSLWSAFGSRPAALAVGAGLALTYLVPPAAALGGSGVGAVGYLAAAVGRYAAAERTGGRSVPDAFAHPFSIAVLLGLLADSWRLRDRGDLTWKGRSL
ncbi:glycosyltransferase family 2 protein [Kineococcus sp. SYSU DK003]|uniref:glycosyltransferase family 2 protein n=1 Tax=Kineococcus sp. SYSU DK003 TaxID=3383124 RepID=UPI003D7E49F1